MLTKTRKWLIAVVLFLAFVLVACTEKVPTLTIEDGDKVITLTAGQDREVVATITGGNEKKEYTLVWESEDEWVAEVDENGVITALNEGTTKITVTVKGTSISVTISVTVGLPAPTEISIIKASFVGDGGVLIGGDPMQLMITTVPEKAIDTVNWVSLDPSVATVDATGKVTGIRGGNVKIRAISTEDDTVRAEVDVIVYEDLEDFNVILNVMEYIKENIPTYVNEDLVLPVYPNKLVTVEYYDKDGNRHPGGIYQHYHTQDYLDTIKVIIRYRNIVKDDFSITVNVVEDLVNNDFEAIEFAKAEVEKFLKSYKEDKIRADVEFPTSFTFGEGEGERVVTVSWTSSDTSKVSHAGVFTRPNDDATLTFEAYFVSGGVTGVTRHQIVVNGYSQEEKIEWLKENVLPKVTEIEGKNLSLATRDSKFGTLITWTTDNADVLSAVGKMNPYLETTTVVNLKATIVYTTAVNGFSFTQELDFPITVKPAANDAQKVILDLVNAFEAGAVPSYFPYGVQDREGGDVIPLPTTVGGEGPYKDTVITWTSGEEGLFDGSWKLLKQYLRYHEVTLTYSVTVDGATATGEWTVNVGVSKTPEIFYIAGRFVATNAGASQPYDGLSTISVADGATLGGTYQGWSGYTFYVDVTDESGKTVRYQMFADRKYTYLIYEGSSGLPFDNSAAGVTFDEEGNMTGKIKGMTGDTNANYQYMFLINLTEHDANIPITYLNYKGSSVKQDINGNAMIRQTAVAYDGARMGFAANSEGLVTFGHEGVWIETAMTELAEKDEEGNFTLPDYVTIPAGGFGWSPFTNHNNPAMGVFCKPGITITMEYYTPIH